jgi:hypothetical protein
VKISNGPAVVRWRRDSGVNAQDADMTKAFHKLALANRALHRFYKIGDGLIADAAGDDHEVVIAHLRALQALNGRVRSLALELEMAIDGLVTAIEAATDVDGTKTSAAKGLSEFRVDDDDEPVLSRLVKIARTDTKGATLKWTGSYSSTSAAFHFTWSGHDIVVTVKEQIVITVAGHQAVCTTTYEEAAARLRAVIDDPDQYAYAAG